MQAIAGQRFISAEEDDDFSRKNNSLRLAVENVLNY
jgi:hypothetical protein